MHLPPEIIAIDWGATSQKRQLCRAVLRGRRYSMERPEPVPDPGALELPPGALVGFDCPIGVSAEYAARAELGSFRAALRAFGHGRFEHFYDVATSPTEIETERPFYPARSSGASREELRRRLGDAAFALRPCDRATGAGPLFWLVGAKQCGRSSITVWREILAPRLDSIALWPFDGRLDVLLRSGKPVVAEMYPAWLLKTLGVEISGKRDPAARAEAGSAIVERVSGVDLIAVRELLLTGFGSSPSGEDAFDATISALALVALLTGDRIPEPPEEVRAVEGWILGL
jgi:hypothetical protein